MAKTKVHDSEQQSHPGRTADRVGYAADRHKRTVEKAQVGEMPITPGILMHVTIKLNTSDTRHKYLMKMAFIFTAVDP
jgi:hypothetical protein